MFGCLVLAFSPSEQVTIGWARRPISRSRRELMHLRQLQVCVKPAISACVPELTFGSGVVASRGSLIVADALVIAVTWWKLFHHVSQRKVSLMRRRVSLTDVFLRDGKYPILLKSVKRSDSYVVGTVYFVYVHSHSTIVASREADYVKLTKSADRF